MSQKLYRKESSGAVCAVGTQTRYVTLPSSTIDLWMPLIGAVGVGVYALYCRLAREGVVRGLDLKRMAKAARVSDNTLRSLNQTLEKIGFIVIEKPLGANRIRHYTTEIRLLEPPTRVPVELIRELECRSGYEILAHWLVESSEAGPAATNPPSGGCEPPTETTGATPLPQPRPQGTSDTSLGGSPQAVTRMKIPPLPQPRPQGTGDASPGGSPQAVTRTKILPLPQPRPQGMSDASLGGLPQEPTRTKIPPLPQPRPQGTGDTGLGGSPQAAARTKIPPLPQPRPQGTSDASLGGLPQEPARTKIPPLPQLRPQGTSDASPGGLPQEPAQTKIPPLPQPRPQGTSDASLGGLPQEPTRTKIPPLPQPRPAVLGNSLTGVSSSPSASSGGPIALSSVIESVWERQQSLLSASQRAMKRQPALTSATGSVPQRVMEAPTSATLESLLLNPLEGENSPPPPIVEKRKYTLPWETTPQTPVERRNRHGLA